jgi:hypothetical protein
MGSSSTPWRASEASIAFGQHHALRQQHIAFLVAQHVAQHHARQGSARGVSW